MKKIIIITILMLFLLVPLVNAQRETRECQYNSDCPSNKVCRDGFCYNEDIPHTGEPGTQNSSTLPLVIYIVILLCAVVILSGFVWDMHSRLKKVEKK